MSSLRGTVSMVYYPHFYTFPKDLRLYLIQWNLSKPNFFGTNVCVQNRQVLALYRLNLQTFPTLRLYLKFSLYRILVNAAFGLDMFLVNAVFGFDRFLVNAAFGLDRFLVNAAVGLDRFLVNAVVGLDRFQTKYQTLDKDTTNDYTCTVFLTRTLYNIFPIESYIIICPW